MTPPGTIVRDVTTASLYPLFVCTGVSAMSDYSVVSSDGEEPFSGIESCCECYVSRQ